MVHSYYMDKGICVFVGGLGSTGSMLIARTLAHVLDVADYGNWEGNGSVSNKKNKIFHTSFPTGKTEPVFPDIQKFIEEHKDTHNIYFVLTTRDETIASISTRRRFLWRKERIKKQNIISQEKMRQVIEDNNFQSFIFSYETFQFLGKTYLNELYVFLGIESNFMPDVYDANKKYVRVSVSQRVQILVKRLRRFMNINKMWVRDSFVEKFKKQNSS